MSAPIPKGKWSWKYKYCFHCGTTKIKHKGWGLCLNCFDQLRAQESKGKANRLRSSRKYTKRNKWKDSFKQSHSEKSKKYYHKNKHNPEFRKKIRKQNLESYYRLKDTPEREHKQRVWQKNNYLRTYYKDFINKNPFYLRKYAGGIQFRCDGCNKNCLITSPVKPNTHTNSENENYMVKLDIFRKLLIKLCKNK